MLDRREILNRAVHDCYVEMYAKSQPSADYDQLVEDVKSGKIGKDERVYNRHYLSQEEYKYIVDKYIDAYGIREKWRPYIDILMEDLGGGGHKNAWIVEYDEDGEEIGGYRGVEKVQPMEDEIKDIIAQYGEEDECGKMAKHISDKVMELISTYRDFYRFDNEESSFSATMALGASPTSNKETVINWWKENKGVDIEIEERNPKLFWYLDNGYTDEDLEYEFGENWKERLEKEWKEELENEDKSY